MRLQRPTQDSVVRLITNPYCKTSRIQKASGINQPVGNPCFFLKTFLIFVNIFSPDSSFQAICNPASPHRSELDKKRAQNSLEKGGGQTGAKNRAKEGQKVGSSIKQLATRLRQKECVCETQNSNPIHK